MRSFSRDYLNGLTLTIEQASTLNRLGEYRGKQDLFSKQTPETLKSLQQVAIIESSESSNRIEGVTAPHDRIKALVLKSAKPHDRSEQEIAGYRDGLALIHESAKDMRFSVSVILHIHSMLCRYMPNEGGRWKTTNNDIVERNPDGTIKRVRFKPVSPVATPPAMDALASGYRDAVEDQHKEPLVVIPLASLDFLCIHPFSDGNGRVARLLTLMLLYQFDYQVGRYISMERIFEESKETYYETLEASSTGWHDGKHDASPWMDYFWGVLLRAYREFEDRVGTIGVGKGSKTEQVRQIVDRRLGPFSISDIEADCIGVSRDMIRIVLRQLRDEGAITLQGKGRGAKWTRREA